LFEPVHAPPENSDPLKLVLLSDMLSFTCLSVLRSFELLLCFLTLVIVLADRQDYSHSSDMGVRESSGFKLGFYANLNVQNIAQEWLVESRRLFYLRTINSVTNNIYKGTTPRRAGNLQNELSEDCRGLNYPSLCNIREHVSSKSIVNRHENTELVKHSMINQPVQSVFPVSVVNNSVKQNMPRGPNVGISLHDISNTEVIWELDNKVHDGDGKKVKKLVVKKRVSSLPTKASFSKESVEARKEVAAIYDKVLVVDNIQSARTVVQLLTTKYKNFIHACDTEVKRNPA
jgi:DNA polymerase I